MGLTSDACWFLLINNNKRREVVLKDEAGGEEKRVFFYLALYTGGAKHEFADFLKRHEIFEIYLKPQCGYYKET